VGLKVFINGRMVEKAEASVSVFDHGLLYGDGVFEGIRAYHGKVFRCKEHVERLFNSAKAIALQIPMSREEMAEAIRQTLRTNGLTDAYIRAVVTRGPGTLGLDPNKCHDPQVIIITDSIQLYPREFYEKGLELVSVPTMRSPHNTLSPKIKSLNYLNNILAKIEAMQAGAIEAIMLNSQGYVAECTGDNIFIIHKGELLTPPPEAGILEGITRAVVMQLALKAGIPVAERNLTRFDLYIAEECFLTGTAAEIIPVVRIDTRDIGDDRPGKTTLKLLEMFREETANNP
jgi:branched-chain amino acid aminotransferase